MTCKYCGQTANGNGYCQFSPNRHHEGVHDGTNCVYCASKFYPSGFCQYSPTKKHIL